MASGNSRGFHGVFKSRMRTLPASKVDEQRRRSLSEPRPLAELVAERFGGSAFCLFFFRARFEGLRQNSWPAFRPTPLGRLLFLCTWRW